MANNGTKKGEKLFLCDLVDGKCCVSSVSVSDNAFSKSVFRKHTAKEFTKHLTEKNITERALKHFEETRCKYE